MLWVHDNCLSLSDLFAASEMITKRANKRLGAQGSALTVSVGSELYAEQSVFNGIYTTYRVLKYYDSRPFEYDGVLLGTILDYRSAPKSAYTIIDGRITFHRTGEYQVTMKNKAIVSHRDYSAEVIVDIEVVEM